MKKVKDSEVSTLVPTLLLLYLSIKSVYFWKPGPPLKNKGKSANLLGAYASLAGGRPTRKTTLSRPGAALCSSFLENTVEKKNLFFLPENIFLMYQKYVRTLNGILSNPLLLSLIIAKLSASLEFVNT